MLSATPDKIVTFGDSISDAGVIFGLTDQLLVVPVPLSDAFVQPGYAGVFSDGPVYPQHFPDLLGTELVGYAVGGARAVGTRPISETLGSAIDFLDPSVPEADQTVLLSFDLNLDAQVDRFLDGDPAFPNGPAQGLTIDETVAATMFIGLNDFGDFIASADFDNPFILLEILGFLGDLEEEVREAAEAVSASDLVDQFVMIAPPPLSFLPIPEGTDEDDLEAADQAIEAYTAALGRIVDDLDGVEAELVDLKPIAEEMAADPRSFGQTAVGPFYLAGGTEPEFGDIDPVTGIPELSYPVNPLVEDTPLDQLRFFDALHPSASTHGVFGAFISSSLVGELAVLDSDAESETFTDQADLVLAGGGGDSVRLLKGDDTALGGQGNDSMFGGNGRDLLGGGTGRDSLVGGNGNDLLVGGLGNDAVKGGRGNDLVLLGQGGDFAEGNNGRDTFVYVDNASVGAGAAQASILGGSGRDTLVILTDRPTLLALQDEIAATSAADKAAGNYDLLSVDITTTSVERILLRAKGLDALDSFAAPSTDLLLEADLWGMV